MEKNKILIVGTIGFILGAIFVILFLNFLKPTISNLSPQNYLVGDYKNIYEIFNSNFINTNNLDVGILNGKSMLPTIPINSKILFIKTDNISIGDIIIRNDKYMTTHRIYKIKYLNGEKCYSTWGDNNRIDDGDCIFISEIMGRVVGVLY